jgi:hypothetical protein
MSAAVAVGTDMYVFGGEDRDSDARHFVGKYDTLADDWTTLAPMPHACYHHSASICSELVYIVGVGDSGQEVLRFDPASGVWTTLAPTSKRRKFCTTFVLGGCLYVAGGFGNYSSVERYNVATDTWTEVADMLEGRYEFGAVTIGSAGPAEEQDLFDSLIDKAVLRQPGLDDF